MINSMIEKYGLKSVLVIISLSVTIIGGILILFLTIITTFASNVVEERSQIAVNGFQKNLENFQGQAIRRADLAATDPYVIDAVIRKDYNAIIESVRKYNSELDIITVVDAKGDVLARLHNPKRGDNLLQIKAIEVALSTGKGIATIEKGSVVGLSTRGSAAVKDRTGRIVGAITCGHDLALPKYVDILKEYTGCDITFFIGDTRMNTTLIDKDNNRAIGTKAPEQVINAVLKNKQDYNARVELFGKRYYGFYSPIIPEDQVIGMIFVGTPIEHILRQERTMLTFIIIAIILLLLVIFITALVIRWTVRKSYWYENILDSVPTPLLVTDMNRNLTFVNKPVLDMLEEERSDMIGLQCNNWGAAICNTDDCGIDRLECGIIKPFLINPI